MTALTWRVALAGVTHAFTSRGTHSLCGWVRRADTVLSGKDEPGTLTCLDCARRADDMPGPT